jgi:hypothetical protein
VLPLFHGAAKTGDRGPRTRAGLTARSIAAIVLLATSLAGCGGTHKARASESTKTDAAAVATTAQLAETVQNEAHGTRVKAVSAQPGDELVFRTTVPGSATPSRISVVVAVTHQPASRWTVTASAAGQSSSAAVTSTDGTALTLARLRYVCFLPPAPSPCPAEHVTSSATSTSLQFDAAPGSEIELLANVGPISPSAIPTKPPGKLALPPYSPVQTVAITPSAAVGAKTASPSAASSVTVGPGDTIALRTDVHGLANGAPQPLTVTVSGGPGAALAVTASVPGGTPSRATVRSATGNPIEIVLPHYDCELPPRPTFCPQKRVQTASHRWAITFAGWPRMPPVVISAEIEAG